MDVATLVSVAWTLAFIVAFAGPAVLVRRRQAAPFSPTATIALAVATFLLVGFGVADGIGIGALALPFGLVAMGALTGAPGGARWLAGTGAALVVALAALMTWGPFTADTPGIPVPPEISFVSWLVWLLGGALLAAAATLLPRGVHSEQATGPLWRERSARWASWIAAALLWAGVLLGPSLRTYFQGGSALVATACAIAASLKRRSTPGRATGAQRSPNA